MAKVYILLKNEEVILIVKEIENFAIKKLARPSAKSMYFSF